MSDHDHNNHRILYRHDCAACNDDDHDIVDGSSYDYPNGRASGDYDHPVSHGPTRDHDHLRDGGPAYDVRGFTDHKHNAERGLSYIYKDGDAFIDSLRKRAEVVKFFSKAGVHGGGGRRAPRRDGPGITDRRQRSTSPWVAAFKAGEGLWW